jgi:hypothetical protein
MRAIGYTRPQRAKVIEALGTMGKSLKDFSKVSIAEKGPSGRATVLAFDDTRVSAPDFRVALSSTELKSTMLDAVEMQGDQVVFKGRGYGHGVGMSQWGAYKMAEEGQKGGGDSLPLFRRELRSLICGSSRNRTLTRSRGFFVSCSRQKIEYSPLPVIYCF